MHTMSLDWLFCWLSGQSASVVSVGSEMEEEKEEKKHELIWDMEALKKLDEYVVIVTLNDGVLLADGMIK